MNDWTPEQSRTPQKGLMVGDRVTHECHDGVGTITEVGFEGVPSLVWIEWDYGHKGPQAECGSLALAAIDMLGRLAEGGAA